MTVRSQGLRPMAGADRHAHSKEDRAAPPVGSSDDDRREAAASRATPKRQSLMGWPRD
jgi:hypothetical protein